MPDGIPKVAELGVTSAPLKSAAFFLGSFCKEYTGQCLARFAPLAFGRGRVRDERRTMGNLDSTRLRPYSCRKPQTA